MHGRPRIPAHAQNKGWDRQTNKIFSYNLRLPNEEGTGSAQSSCLLKDEGGDGRSSIKHIAQMYCANGKIFHGLTTATG